MDDQSTSDRLRSRLSGAAGSMVPVAPQQQQILRRRRSSLTESELSVNTNAASAGGSEIGSPPRVASKPAFAPRRPKVSFPSSHSSSALQTLSRQSPEPTQNGQHQQHQQQHQHNQHNRHQQQEPKKPARISLRPALKPSSSHPSGQHTYQHRPPIPPPPSSDATSTPSTVSSLTDSEIIPPRRPGGLSFRPAQKIERPQLPSPPQSAGRLPYSMPGGWDELDEPDAREEHNEMIRRRPAAYHQSLPSSPRHGPREIEYIPDSRRQSESDFSDTDLSENTEVTTTESDTTVSYTTQPSRKTKVHLPNSGNNTLARSNSNRDSDKRA
ncbi:hypothetical protein MAPG_06169, partial [Magnaporthiopsis poae ATCC 64411]